MALTGMDLLCLLAAGQDRVLVILLRELGEGSKKIFKKSTLFYFTTFKIFIEPFPKGALHVIIFHSPPGGSCSWHVARQEEENHVEVISESLVHPVVDDGVNTGGGHGQPVEGQVDVVDVGDPLDGGVVVGVDEVDVVGSPAHHEDPDHHREHLDQLT